MPGSIYPGCGVEIIAALQSHADTSLHRVRAPGVGSDGMAALTCGTPGEKSPCRREHIDNKNPSAR